MMSIELIRRALNCQLPAGQKDVLLSLCDMANEHNECWPAITQISRRCGTGPRITLQHLADLEAADLIVRRARSDFAPVYTITLPKDAI
ncbi:helix-turn-helix domain-containing protein [Collimonas sp. NPDC087041]|uniref:helix-turn-helix domain-containing protein n=1 Tax=Collimonas sp. NPDC087041 TaxID=3363960 RepID=UPI00380EDDD4